MTVKLSSKDNNVKVTFKQSQESHFFTKSLRQHECEPCGIKLIAALDFLKGCFVAELPLLAREMPFLGAAQTH